MRGGRGRRDGGDRDRATLGGTTCRVPRTDRDRRRRRQLGGLARRSGTRSRTASWRSRCAPTIDGVEVRRSQIKVYFDRDYFPGYGWLFVDDAGFANVGLGYAFDKKFPLVRTCRETSSRFIERELGGMLRRSSAGRISGGAAAFYRPNAIVGDRVMLVGDAANQADPLNGGGIHKAMEGASLAAEAALHALAVGDFSAPTLGLYEQLWAEHFESDWKTAEFFLSVAKNPALRDFCLYLLTQIGLSDHRGPAVPGVRERRLQRHHRPERVPLAARALRGVSEAAGDLDRAGPARRQRRRRRLGPPRRRRRREHGAGRRTHGPRPAPQSRVGPRGRDERVALAERGVAGPTRAAAGINTCRARAPTHGRV